MREYKIIIASTIFILLTAIKLAVPAQMDAIRPEVNRQIDRNIDYKAVATELVASAKQYAGQLEGIILEDMPEVTPIPTPTPTPIPTPTLTPIAIPTPMATPTSEVEETVAVFAESTSLLPFDYAPPVAVNVSSAFGERIHPVDGISKFHYGVDLAANTGDEIAAFADGTVTTASYCDGYGYYIIIEHDATYSTLYAHCSELNVELGDTVTMGQVIAKAGATGLVTGPHLHFEVRENGTCVDPMGFLC